jgi:signal transduction histidine kinase
VLSRLVNRFRTANPWVLDAVLTAVWLIVGLITTSGNGQYNAKEIHHRDTWAIVLMLGIVLPYLLRRRFPLTVLLVSGTLVTIYVASKYNEGGLPTLIIVGAYTVGAWCSTRKGLVGMGFIVAALLAVVASPAPRFSWGAFTVNVAAFSAAFFFGTTIRSRRLRLEALEQRAVAVEHEHAEKQARVLSDERLRIAHELHDVIAHSMGVIAVQAGVGAHVIDSDPAEAKKALTAISEVSRTTLGEIRRILAALRQEDGGGAAHAPAPTLGDLDRLVAEVRGAGLDVHLERDGATGATVPHGVEMAAYRIVQEALTNVLKHAGPARADVCVSYEPGVLHVTVTDDGRGVNARSNGGGHGLIGMRERVGAYGGSFRAGPRAGGGFEVDAAFPYGASS